MRNLKKFKASIIGILALVTAVALNMRHAFNDYGIKDNKLHVQVLAQSNSSGGNTDDGNTTSGSTTSGNTTDGNTTGGNTTGGGTTNDNGGSNDTGGSNIYYYKTLGPDPKSCTLTVYITAEGQVYYNRNEMSAGVSYQSETRDGNKETCPKKNGNGCTVYSCHVTTNTGGQS